MFGKKVVAMGEQQWKSQKRTITYIDTVVGRGFAIALKIGTRGNQHSYISTQRLYFLHGAFKCILRQNSTNICLETF